MKTVNMREARKQLADLVEQSQAGPVWLTRHGRPVALLLGVEGRVDMGSVVIEGDPAFWETIERVRKSDKPRYSEAEARKVLGLPPAKPPKPPKRPVIENRPDIAALIEQARRSKRPRLTLEQVEAKYNIASPKRAAAPKKRRRAG